MSERPDRDILILAEFHDGYLSDCDAGRKPVLEDFLRRFPGHEELIRVEFALLEGREVAGAPPDLQATISNDGEQVGHYRLLEVLGRGGQAVVWLAEDVRVGRKVALKLFRCDPLEAPAQLARFKREAALTAKIDHPAICPMLDLGMDGQPFIAMRYVPGQTLAAILNGDRGFESPTESVVELPVREDPDPSTTGARSSGRTSSLAQRQRGVLDMVEKVARAIHSAHELGIVHRDLKPNNIMIRPDGEPVVLDFGVAFEEDSEGVQLTATGDVIGTPSYLAPEQIASGRGRIDRRTDVHALGVILFECLTLRRPYVAPNREALFRMILHEEAPRLRSINPSFSADLEVVVEMALQKNPAHRYDDALALAEDLLHVIERRPILARPIGPVTRSLRWAQRNPQLALSLVSIFVLLCLGLLATWILLGHTRAALHRETEALRERQSAFDELLRQKEGVFRLRAQATLHDLEKEVAEDLWPLAASSRAELDDKIVRIDQLLERAAAVAAGLDSPDPETGAPSHRRQLELLRARALPRSAELLEEDRRRHPRFAELESLLGRRAAERRGLAIREGREELVLPEIAPETVPAAPPLHMKLILAQVRGNRSDFGQEAEGLARARLLADAVRGLSDPGAQFWVGATLTWAELANGLDAEARLDHLAASLEAMPENERGRGQEELTRLDEALSARRGAAWPALVADLDRRALELEAIIAAERVWEFGASDDRWWHENLTGLTREIERFTGPTGPLDEDGEFGGWSVHHRREHLTHMVELLDEGAADWSACQARIHENPVYRGLELDLQFGLAPLGPDPKSGLEEFWDPAAGSRPERDPATGRFKIGEETGLVFVLLPPGIFVQGAQASNPDASGYDPLAGPQEGPVLSAPVEAFFLSRYEMTQGQFLRLALSSPSTQGPGFGLAGTGRVHDLRHPVETVSWEAAVEVLKRFGWSLPTERQWEYAARGGTTSPWWCGDDGRSLSGTCNIADAAAGRRKGINWPAARVGLELGLEDGFVFHAPVGSLAPNPFGMEDILGNVAEWCDGRTEVPARDGGAPTSYRNSRGGHFMSDPRQARVTMRQLAAESAGFDTIGIRPARPIR